jgi:hypothetical protein
MRRAAADRFHRVRPLPSYLRAVATYYPTKERIFAALGLLEQAIAIDPQYGPALSWAAMCNTRLVIDGWTDESETNRHKGIYSARQVLQAAENDPASSPTLEAGPG